MFLALFLASALSAVDASGADRSGATLQLAQTGGGGGQGGDATSNPVYHCNVPGACPQLNVGGEGGAGGSAIGGRPAAAPSTNAPRQARVRDSVSQGFHNIRSGPGSAYRPVVSVPAGQTVQFIGNCRAPEGGGRSQWCQVSWKGQAGWSSMSGLKLLQ